MKNKSVFSLLVIVVAFTLSIAVVPVQAAEYPTGPITLVNTNPPGGFVDIVGRAFASEAERHLGKPMVMVHKPGAAGLLGGALAAKAAPDGYTLLLNGSIVWLLPLMRDNTPWDMFRDFAPVGLVTRLTFVLDVHPSVPAKSVKELVALAKAQPGKLNYASGGGGGGLHLAAELFNLTAGVKITHVPYKGGAPGMTALMASEVHMMFSGLSAAVPHIKSGKLRALAVGGSKRFPLVPDVPTVAESGFPFSASGWYGVLAPRNTPQAIVTRAPPILSEIQPPGGRVADPMRAPRKA